MLIWVQWFYDPVVYFLGTVLLVIQIGGIVAAGHAVMTDRTSQGTIAWVLFLLVFPVLALPMYLVFGGHRFRGYIRARRAEDRALMSAAASFTEGLAAFRPQQQVDGGGIEVIERLAHLPITSGNTAEVLIDGKATFQSIFDGIESAKDYIIIQFYIVQADNIGCALRDRLLQKLAEGVRVYFLYDEIGSYSLPRTYLRRLRKAGAEIYPFNSSVGWRNPLRLNFRNHRKIVIVDGKFAWVGGHNVGDEYLGGSKRFGHWRDSHIKLAGPSVQCIQFTFLDDWYWATQTIPRFQWEPQPPADADETRQVVVLPGGPADEVETISLAFIHLIQNARRRIWIQSPYFVPDEQIVSALQLATLRGVDVRILLPQKSDHLLVWLSSFYYTGQEKLRDVRIFRYLPGFLHSKMMLVDDEVTFIGTANLDNRSFYINFEIMIGVLDSQFNAQVEAVMERDFSNAREVGPEDYTDRPLWLRIAARTARLMAPIL